MHKLRFGRDFSKRKVTENFYEFISENKNMFSKEQKIVLETILDWLLTSHHGNKVPQSTIDFIYSTVNNILNNIPIQIPDNKASLSLFNITKGVYSGAKSAAQHGITGIKNVINRVRNAAQING